MADDAATDDDVKTDPISGKDKKSKQQRMLIIIGVVGLILSYILIRSRASSSSSGTATTGTDQALAQYEQTNASDLAGLQSQLQSLQGVVAGMYPTMGSGDGTTGTSTGTGTTTTAPPTTTTTTQAAAPAGPTYTGLTDSSLLQPLTMSNTPLFYMAGGNYEQVGDQPGNTTDPELAWIQQNLQPGTGIYVQNS